MIPILYESNEVSFTSNGIGRLRDCISCVVTEERNGIYECDFEYPVDGANFDKIQCGRVVAVRHDDSKDVQPFDIVSYSKPINGIVTFHCVHISYRQRGLVVKGKNINTLADAFTLLGTATPTNPFTYEADFASTAYMAAADGTPRSVRQMLGGVEGSILDTYGGEYEFDRFRVVLHKRRGQDRTFSIRYGVNLLDYTEDTDFEETYNSVVPYWTGSDGVKNIIAVGNKATSSASTYANREICAALDLTDKFESKPTKAQLTTMAQSILNTQQTTLPKQTIKVDFVRLQDLGEYTDLQSLLQCNLCDTIEVIFPRYDMRGRYKIVKTTFDVIRGKYISLELGSLSTTLAQALGITDSSRKSEADLIYTNDDGDVEVNAGMVVNGTLTVQGHSSPIGTVLNFQNDSTMVIPSGTSTPLLTFDLPEGVWVVRVLIRFPVMGSDRTKYVYANISGTNGSTGYMYRQPCENMITNVMLPQIINTTGDTYYVNVYHNSGSDKTFATGSSAAQHVRAVRIA